MDRHEQAGGSPAGGESGDRTAHDLLIDGLMTADEVAEFLRLGKTKIYMLMNDGTLPYVPPDGVCKGRRVPRRAVIDLMAGKLIRAGG